jgi:hypothetical protein
MQHPSALGKIFVGPDRPLNGFFTDHRGFISPETCLAEPFYITFRIAALLYTIIVNINACK